MIAPKEIHSVIRILEVKNCCHIRIHSSLTLNHIKHLKTFSNKGSVITSLIEKMDGSLIVQKKFSKNEITAIHQFKKELSFSKIVRCEFVGQIIEWYEDSDHFILEYPLLGLLNFKQYLEKQTLTVETFKTLISIIQNLLEGLDSLHKFDIIHYDVKPDNIVLNDDLELHIIDTANWQKSGKPILCANHLHSFTHAFGTPEHYSRGIPLPQTDFYQVAITLIYALVEEAQFTSFRNSQCSLTELIDLAWAPNPTCRDILRSILTKSTTESPKDRWTDVDEFSNELSILINSA